MNFTPHNQIQPLLTTILNTPNTHLHIIDTVQNPVLGRDPYALFLAFADTFAFAEYYGYNITALEDCLKTKASTNHVVILGINNLFNDPGLINYLLSILYQTVEYFRRVNKQFSVHLVNGSVFYQTSVL